MLGSDDIDLWASLAPTTTVVRSDEARRSTLHKLRAGLVLTIEEFRGSSLTTSACTTSSPTGAARAARRAHARPGSPGVAQDVRARARDEHAHVILCEAHKQPSKSRARKRCCQN